MKRKLGIVCECVRGIDTLDALDIIKEVGFDSIFTGAINCEKVRQIKEKADKLGLDVDFIHAPFKNINNMWLEGDDYLEIYNGMIESIDSAAANNIPMIIVHLSSGWEAPQINDLGLSRYDALVDYAEKKGITVAFENLRKVGNVAYFVDRYNGREYVKFCYDNGHEYCYTKTVDWLDIFTYNVGTTHIHDNFGRGQECTGDPDLHYLPFDGTFDFKKMMRKLDEYEYTGTLMLEVFNSSKPEYREMSPRDFIQTAFDRITKISNM